MSRLLVPLKRLFSKQCGPTSNCSPRIWVHTLGLYVELSHCRKHLHAAVDFNRRTFQIHFKSIANKGQTKNTSALRINSPSSVETSHCVKERYLLVTIRLSSISDLPSCICFVFLSRPVVKAAYSVTMNIFRKKNIFFLNHLQK